VKKHPSGEVVEPKKAVAITAFFRHKKVERQKGLRIRPFLPHKKSREQKGPRCRRCVA